VASSQASNIPTGDRTGAGPAVVRPQNVTIVVLNWNRRQETLECLESLTEARCSGATVLVVDNGSQDGSVEAIRDRFPDLQVIALAENRGYAGGNNVGIRAALGAAAKGVLLLNNDTKVAPDFLGWLVGVLNDHPQAAAVSSAVLRVDSPEVLDVAYLDIYFGHGLVHRRGVNALPGQGFDVLKRIEVGIGCSLLIRSEALERVGFLDESYFAYHEEVDWCFRARKAGYEIYYQPLSRVWHHGSRSTLVAAGPPRAGGAPPSSQLDNAMPLSWNPVRTYLGARNSVRFVRTHGSATQKAYFVLSSLYAVPLALLAVVLDREEELMLGLWTYRKALALYCLPPAGVRFRLLRGLGRAPIGLLWHLPRDVWRAHREQRTAQLRELVRGLLDGMLNRSLPLQRLGLR
jgi:GT2 family glycosyltransferase